MDKRRLLVSQHDVLQKELEALGIPLGRSFFGMSISNVSRTLIKIFPLINQIDQVQCVLLRVVPPPFHRPTTSQVASTSICGPCCPASKSRSNESGIPTEMACARPTVLVLSPTRETAY